MTMTLWPPGVLVSNPPGQSWEEREWPGNGDGAGTGTEPTVNPLHTKKHGKRRKREGVGAGGVGLWGRSSIRILLPLTVSWWKNGGGVSLSLLPLLNWGYSSTACCGPEGEGAKPVAWGTRAGWPPLPLRQWSFAHTHPMADATEISGIRCSVGKRWLWHNARRVGRATGTGTHLCQALDSP